MLDLQGLADALTGERSRLREFEREKAKSLA
jgi:hypothetical protein